MKLLDFIQKITNLQYSAIAHNCVCLCIDATILAVYILNLIAVQSEGRYQESLKKSKQCLKLINSYNESTIKNK